MPAMQSENSRVARSAARLAAVQALYQREMEPAAPEALVSEFVEHRLGATLDGERLAPADADFFRDLVCGASARMVETDDLITTHLATGWTLDRLDRPMRAILRLGTYELIARPDIPVGVVIGEYLNVAHAFYQRREAGFVNGLLDAVARKVRAAA